MNREDLIALKLKLESKIEAINLLLEDEGIFAEGSGIGTKRGQKKGASSSAQSGVAVRSIMGMVRETITRMGGDFTANDIFQSIKTRYPKLKAKDIRVIKNPMWQLQRTGEIEVITKGGGRRPNIYRWVMADDQMPLLGIDSRK